MRTAVAEPLLIVVSHNINVASAFVTQPPGENGLPVFKLTLPGYIDVPRPTGFRHPQPHHQEEESSVSC